MKTIESAHGQEKGANLDSLTFLMLDQFLIAWIAKREKKFRQKNSETYSKF